MLYHIVSVDDNKYARYVKDITKLYWPKDKYKDLVEGILPEKGKLESDENIQEIREKLETICQQVGKEELYHLYKSGGQEKFTSFPFPFVARFHQYFFKRQWEEPFENPKVHFNEYIHLHPKKMREIEAGEKNTELEGKNYSRNYKNYNHFVNVVSALARLIKYFSNEKKVMDILVFRTIDGALTEHATEELARTLTFNTSPDFRTFILMIAGFFHDIGKTITDPRHGTEGYIILAFHMTEARVQLNQIVKQYDAKYEFHKDDLLYIANLVRFHDQFGTISTGEDSYNPLNDIVMEIERYSLGCHTDQFKFAQRCLFDVWLLNVADIIVSLSNNKGELQDWSDWQEAQSRIERFFQGISNDLQTKTKASCLSRDLVLALNVLNEHLEESPWSDPSNLRQSLFHCTRRHSFERIRRLLIATLSPGLDDYTESRENKMQNSGDKQKEAMWEFVTMLVPSIINLTPEQWDSSIIRSIESITTTDEFCTRLSWIGKMDYAYGFFAQIAKRALLHVANEWIGTGRNTGWVRSNDGTVTGDYLYKIQAQFFADNYAATVIQILSYLLFREAPVERVRNIQFGDAMKRLNDEKIDKIISMEGPFRARRSIQLILQTVYLY